MDRHRKVETRGKEKLNEDWKEEISFTTEYSNLRNKFIEMLEEFGTMWEGRLRRITIARNCLELNVYETRPIHFASNCAGRKVMELERRVIYKMLRMNVIKPTHTK